MKQEALQSLWGNLKCFWERFIFKGLKQNQLQKRYECFRQGTEKRHCGSTVDFAFNEIFHHNHRTHLCILQTIVHRRMRVYILLETVR